jgi:hypothetical protein
MKHAVDFYEMFPFFLFAEKIPPHDAFFMHYMDKITPLDV